MKKKRLLWLIPIVAVLCLTVSAAVYAIEYSGEAGAGTGTPASGNYSDFCLLHAGACDHNSVVGYRFTVVDCLGLRRGRTVDVYRDRAEAIACASSCTGGSRIYWNEYGYSGFSLLGADGALCGKLENLREAEAEQPFSLERCGAGKYRESALSMSAKLPVPTLIGAWIEDGKNAGAVCSLCIGSGSELNYGDIVIIEPILSCRVENSPCGLTASDLCRLGLSYYGDIVPEEIDGGYGFAWMRTWVYRTFPNLLSVTDGSRASLLNLKTGTKLLSRARPLRILEGAYGMGMGIELSPSISPPLLEPLLVEAYRAGKICERSDNPLQPEIIVDYLESETVYTLRVRFSEETSDYRVQRSWWIDGAADSAAESAVHTRITSTKEEYEEIAVVPSGLKPYIDLHIREDWVSEDNRLIQKGTEKVFRLLLKPSLLPQIIFRDRMEKELTTAYRGQRVRTEYSVIKRDETPAPVSMSCYYEEVEEGLVSEYLLSRGQRLFYRGGYHTVTEPGLLDASLEARWKDRRYPAYRSIPVVTADLEIYLIEFRGADGSLLNPDELPTDMPVTPVLYLANHTETTVYATVYAEGEPLGSVALEADTTLEVEAPAIIRRDEGPFSYSAEVYMEGQGRSAELEYNPHNNMYTVRATAVRLFCLTPLEGSPVYHTETDVYTTLRFYNRSPRDFSDNGVLRMSIYAPNGKRYLSMEGPAVCPAGEDSFLYFSWYVDEALLGRVKIVAELSEDGGKTFLPSATVVLFAEVTALPKSSTPDTVYEARGPYGFTAPSVSQAISAFSVGWHEWSFESETFTRHDYRASLKGKALIWPITGLSAVLSGDRWTVRSGYGLAASVEALLQTEFEDCTGFQNGYALFPEFDYRFEEECFTTLTPKGELTEHFMPLWYPDGSYTLLMCLDDFWTPGGKIALRVPATVSVSGSLYDDRYIGR